MTRGAGEELDPDEEEEDAELEEDEDALLEVEIFENVEAATENT